MTEETEDKEMDVFEFYLTKEEIDEFIGRLNELKESKKNIEFEIDDKNLLVINFDEGEE